MLHMLGLSKNKNDNKSTLIDKYKKQLSISAFGTSENHQVYKSMHKTQIKHKKTKTLYIGKRTIPYSILLKISSN